ncbi:hypothetical protein APA73_34610 [Pseudomonas aeruginosa]|nr:hypothetical protein CD800_04050 [Pseudomonas aeruginosa]ASP05286.1 hypothetical protein CGU46_10505 [Pseudomonas aeruginosa]ASP12811.1 hypothetical protein CGU45_16315 [Pseudomonas aeruginosa]KSC50920.2 hypothetical protein AO883_34460 [Pseudomonas aeruginosa]KSF12276.2 hypothetical protein AO935_32900 [Pseudomonas aeruginosa]
MTFRVETLFDQTHTCSTGHDDPDHITDRDLRTWTCSPPFATSSSAVRWPTSMRRRSACNW